MDTHDNDWQVKAWGRTRRTIASDLFERHELEVDRGGYCSVHYHRDRANRFIVRSGRIAVCEFYGWQIKRTFLGPDNQHDVPSRVVHQFQVIESGCVVEDYWPDKGGTVRNDDIVRLSVGGNVEQGVDSWNTLLSREYNGLMQLFANELGVK